jgi:hypothetical protein
MEDDQGTEDLFGEDRRSKVQAKGGRQYEDRRVCAVQPILAETETIVAHRDGCSCS